MAFALKTTPTNSDRYISHRRRLSVRTTLTITMNIRTAFMNESLNVSQASPGLIANGIERRAASVNSKTKLTSRGRAVSRFSNIICVGTKTASVARAIQNALLESQESDGNSSYGRK